MQRICQFVLAALLLSGWASAQHSKLVHRGIEGDGTTASVAAQLRSLTKPAGMIVSGTVVDARRSPVTQPHSFPTVQVRFRVEQAIRGVGRQRTLIFREWAGLWSDGDRYRPGEHCVLFLYPASRLGLTSLVHGKAGTFVVDDAGQVLLGALRPSQLPGAKRIALPAADTTSRIGASRVSASRTSDRVSLEAFTSAIRQAIQEER